MRGRGRHHNGAGTRAASRSCHVVQDFIPRLMRRLAASPTQQCPHLVPCNVSCGPAHGFWGVLGWRDAHGALTVRTTPEAALNGRCAKWSCGVTWERNACEITHVCRTMTTSAIITSHHRGVARHARRSHAGCCPPGSPPPPDGTEGTGPLPPQGGRGQRENAHPRPHTSRWAGRNRDTAGPHKPFIPCIYVQGIASTIHPIQCLGRASGGARWGCGRTARLQCWRHADSPK